MSRSRYGGLLNPASVYSAFSQSPPKHLQDRTTILLIEDNPDDVQVLRRLVMRQPGSFRVDLAYTGAEAIEKIASGGFDIAFVDHQLPDQSGLTFIKTIRILAPNLPVVMLTGHGDERLAVAVMKAGAYDFVRKRDLDDEALDRILRYVLERSRLEREVHQAQEQLRERAIRDSLTGLFNHRYFQEQLRVEFERAQRYQRPLACLMLDLDHFKSVNDTFGHPFGDQVLRTVAQILIREARKVDVIARYGGEEFAIILPSTSAAGAQQVAERIRTSVANTPLDFDGHPVTITVSIGVATNQDTSSKDEKSLIRDADLGLYRAKRAGRNRVGGPGQASRRPRTTTGPFPKLEDLDIFVLARVTRVLGQLVDALDVRSGRPGRSRRIANGAARFGGVLGMSRAQLKILWTAGLLHEVGRLARPDETERPRLGGQLAETAGFPVAVSRIIEQYRRPYSDGGHPLEQVLAIISAYVTGAEVDPRSTLERLKAAAGHQYDPSLVDAFLNYLGRLSTPEALVAPVSVAGDA